MPSLTQCIEHFKAELQSIANQPMTQNYDGLGDLVFPNKDTAEAQKFAASLQNNVASHKTSINHSYSSKSLQSAWNIADTLSIVIQYTPCEWSAGFFRGLIAPGKNGEMNATNLLISIIYMSNEMSVVPYIVDDTTYRINQAFLNFTKEVQTTDNGASILALIQQLSKRFLNESIILDKQVIEAAEASIQAYEQYKAQSSQIQIEVPQEHVQETLIYKTQLSSLRASAEIEVDEEDGLIIMMR